MTNTVKNSQRVNGSESVLIGWGSVLIVWGIHNGSKVIYCLYRIILMPN